MVESHVIVYCDTCGDLFTDADGESICFDNANQAIAFLTHTPVALGWVYDGDQITCDACQATNQCATDGHSFPSGWRTTVWPLGNSTRSRTCTVCGVPEIEAL